MTNRGMMLVAMTMAGFVAAAGSSVIAFADDGMRAGQQGATQVKWRGGHGGHYGHGKGWMKHADANKDGIITLEETLSVRDKKFERFDADKNGIVTDEEVQVVVQERVDRMSTRIVRRFDQNRDGKITRDEYDRFAKERFSWMDLNDNGKIEKDELPGPMRHEKKK